MNDITTSINTARDRAEKRLFKMMAYEIKELAKQEDAPLYEGDKEIDYSVRLSDVLKIIEKYSN